MDLGSLYAFARGKLRRFLLGHFSKSRVEQMLSRRRGECKRCGACCALLWRCPHLDFDDEGKAICRIYRKRYVNCRIFPLDRSELKERDLVKADTICGYWFEDGE